MGGILVSIFLSPLGIQALMRESNHNAMDKVNIENISQSHTFGLGLKTRVRGGLASWDQTNKCP